MLLQGQAVFSLKKSGCCILMVEIDNHRRICMQLGVAIATPKNL